MSPVAPVLDVSVVDRWVALPHARRFVLKQFILKQAAIFKTQQYVHVFLAACWNTTLTVALLQALRLNCLAFSRRNIKVKVFCLYTKPDHFLYFFYVQQIKSYVGMFKE